jgi:hypothetical protein
MNAHMTEVRSRALTNARAATRSLDLPLAIGDPRVFPQPVHYSVHRLIPASALRPQRKLFVMVPRP